MEFLQKNGRKFRFPKRTTHMYTEHMACQVYIISFQEPISYLNITNCLLTKANNSFISCFISLLIKLL